VGEGEVNVFDVAKYTLHTIGEEVSTMKLQKLCYYCQAWNLAKNGKPLFDENFERWDYGPVYRELFNQHKGKLYVSEDDIDGTLCMSGAFPIEAKERVCQILGMYGQYNGAQLSEITHRRFRGKKPKGTR
jgi:uncharacterized phage-associated protein